MKVRAINSKVSPVYWAHLRPWPHGKVMEYDVSEQELAAIKADARLELESVVEAPSTVDINRVFVEDGIVVDEDRTPSEKRGPGRPKKVK